jgi:hypothetical protein
MTLTRRSVPLAFACVALALSSCRADGGVTSPVAASCKSEAAQGLVGKPKPTDQAAMHLTGAKAVRQIAPGDMMTQDFREDRVTIETDTASGLVTRTSCG